MPTSSAIAGLLPAAVLSVTACTTVQTSPARDFVSVDAPVVALTNVRVIDGTGTPARPNQTIVIRDGTIEAIGDGHRVTASIGARVIDLSGRTIVPGYVMLHEHLFGTPDGSGYVNTSYSFAPLYLAGGATTIRTGGANSLTSDVRVREAIEGGELAGPDIDVTSEYLHGPGWFEFSSGAEPGKRLVARWSEQGATSFKAYEGIGQAN